MDIVTHKILLGRLRNEKSETRIGRLRNIAILLGRMHSDDYDLSDLAFDHGVQFVSSAESVGTVQFML